MSVFKCKMCGGTLELNQGETVGVCDHCGTKQTLPKLDDEKRVQLYDRANHFRRENEFDKAMGIYEMILAEDREDAEAYWGIVLCKYGIEYVEDPRSHKRIPTVNRAQYTSVFDDKDYLSAIQHADGYQRDIYEEEARAIDAIQKGILEISAKEEPFDVFICYKETDELGNRTQDSVYAQELYNALKKEGYKVFFARITLENKLGQQYEPFIFAALHSAKVMLVVGTSKENFNAVWVKNEWSRFLALSKEDSSKVLIPCYKGISPYDMPEEFTYLQSQDMGKIGYIQDVIHGIEKFVKKETVKETVVVSGGNANTAPLLKRAFMFLEDGDWQSADEYCEKVLDIDPENGEAYLGKLMAELKVRKVEQLADCAQPFDSSSNYQKAIRFGDSKLKTSLEGFVKHIVDRNENARLIEQYTAALNKMQTATDEKSYHIAASAFRTISGFKDADELYSQCVDKAEACRKDAIYDSSISKMENNSIEGYESAIKGLKSISGWKDSDEQIAICQNRIEEIKAKEESDRLEAERQAEKERIRKEEKSKKNKKAAIIMIAIMVVFAIVVVVFSTVVLPKQKLDKAMELLESGDYEASYSLLDKLGKTEVIEESKYNRSMDLLLEEKYDEAYSLLKSIGKNDVIEENKYERAIKSEAVGEITIAYELFSSIDYKDSKERANNLYYEYCMLNAQEGSIITFGTYEQDNNSSNGKEPIEWIVLTKKNNRLLVLSKKGLDCLAYNTEQTSVTWELCSIRFWLNDTFFNNAFNMDEQQVIPSVTVVAESNSNYPNVPAGNNTNDRVFLLSISEINMYLPSENARQCRPTEYAKTNGAAYDNSGNCWYWLRSPGFKPFSAASVSYGGGIGNDGSVNDDKKCVRPAMWIDLSNISETEQQN